jgi:hypothetical protein
MGDDHRQRKIAFQRSLAGRQLQSPADQYADNERLAGGCGWTFGEPCGETEAVSASQYARARGGQHSTGTKCRTRPRVYRYFQQLVHDVSQWRELRLREKLHGRDFTAMAVDAASKWSLDSHEQFPRYELLPHAGTKSVKRPGRDAALHWRTEAGLGLERTPLTGIHGW